MEPNNKHLLKNPKISKKYYILLLTALFVFVSLMTSTWVLLNIYNNEQNKTQSLASLSEVNGDVLYIDNTSGKRMKAFMGLKLKKFDRLLIAPESSAVLDFNTGHKLKVFENSELNVRFWDNTTEDLPIFVSLRRGQYDWISQRPEGQIIIESDQNISQVFESLPVKTDTQKVENEEEDLNIAEEITPQDPSKSLTESTMTKPSNMEISLKIKSYLEQLQKCQLNALGSSQIAKGQLIVAFSILPKGKTEEISILSSSTQSDQLDSCVKSVFERMTFQKFSGDPILINYPLRFE